ncbi:MAG TPA: DUF111 family protein, partial [Methanocorpusculum sp.]|nr:DUF111 family protein [Methanocorpusculum sp.]
MQLLVFDPSFGATGGMILSSLIAAGADANIVKVAIKEVSVPTIETVTCAGISAFHVETHSVSAHRTIDEVFAIISKADAPEAAKALAKKVFRRIEVAEEMVHHTPNVHFHEIEDDDAIA